MRRVTDERHELWTIASTPALWRPWVLAAGDERLETSQRPSGSDGDQSGARSKGAHGFQHPVRLYMPKSKCQEYLRNTGEKVLSSFPVQATIHFYNDDTDSEDEEDEAEFYQHYRDYHSHMEQNRENHLEPETETIDREKRLHAMQH
ncbi:protein ripply3 isoform X2 [Ambystoma mexicanum]|uniref:protein ripply3 isoform X2 n=1 Tax=Ambystoma mexicanum TaxID=8296 RepID=UPI0037E9BF58